VGGSLQGALGFNGATLALLAAFAVGFSLFTGLSWLRLMERIGAGLDAGIAWIRAKREERVDRRIGEAARQKRDVVVERSREEEELREPILVVPPVVAVPKSERVVKEKQRPLFTEMPDSPLPP